jgi:hypothetical protein
MRKIKTMIKNLAYWIVESDVKEAIDHAERVGYRRGYDIGIQDGFWKGRENLKGEYARQSRMDREVQEICEREEL